MIFIFQSVTKDSKGSILLINIAFVDLMWNFFLTLRRTIDTTFLIFYFLL